MINPSDLQVGPRLGLRELNLIPAGQEDPGWVSMQAGNARARGALRNLNECAKTPLPFGDEEFEVIDGQHILEHLNDPLPVLEEFYRISKNGALLTLTVFYGTQDPFYMSDTAKRPYFIDSFLAFSQPYYWRRPSNYQADWQPRIIELSVGTEYHANQTDKQVLTNIHQLRNIELEMTVTLAAIKPRRPRQKSLLHWPQIHIQRL